jgi:protein-disulfide isomerase
LRSDLVQKSKVQLVARDFPLPMHKYAREAACIACAAGRLGKREIVADELYRTQKEWSATGQIDPIVQKVLGPADFKKVKALAKDPSVSAQVDADIALGKQNHLTQTPTMVITAKGKRTPVAGNISYSILRRYLETLF